MFDLACKDNFTGYDAFMSVKNLTLSCFFVVMVACSRQPKVRVYLEEIQVPTQTEPQRAAPEIARSPSMMADLPSELPPDHPLRTMSAPPLTVEPIPENLPPGHPTLSASGIGQSGTPVLTDPNRPAPSMPSPGASRTAAAPMMGRESEVPPPPAADDLAWEVPEGWRQYPGAGMRLASFSIEGDESGALTTLIVLGAGAGGLEANVARWRAERALPPEAPNAPMQVGGQMNFFFVDMVNESLEAGHDLTTVGAIFDLGRRTAFLKFVGPPEVVARQRIPFLQLAGSFRQVEEMK